MQHVSSWWYMCLTNLQPPVQRITSVELISALEHDLDGDALLKSCYLFDEQDREIPHQDISEAAQRALFCDALVSKLHGTCIPTSSDLGCLRCSLKNLLPVFGSNFLKEWLKEEFNHLRYRDEIPESRELDPLPEHIIALFCEHFKVEKEQIAISKRGTENVPQELEIYLGGCSLTIP